MSKALKITSAERGLVRVFSLSMSETAAEALKGDADKLQAAIGAPVNPAHVEVFALKDLGDMSLAEYLVEGPGVDTKALDTDRIKLGALEGWVLIVYSSAFAGVTGQVTPRADLTLIGTYPQEGVDWSDTVDLSTPSALPYQNATPTVRKTPSDAAMAGRVATAALLVIFALVGLMIWVGG